MRILAGLITMGAIVGMGMAANAATATQPSHLSDVGYMEAARCVGLASSPKLGPADGAALKALLESQTFGRAPFILDKADEMQRTAKREADRADEFSRDRLIAELKGQCAALRG